MRSLDDARTLGQFVHNLREGVYITTAQGRILDANPAFLEMFGFASLDEMRSYTATSLVVDPRRRAEEVGILSAEGAVREYELEILRPDGQTRTVLDTAYQVVDDATGETLYHGILVDITDRKNLERQLRDLAVRDPLTGCHNRRYLQEVIRGLEEAAAAVGVIVVDIDHFKSYNDRHGHDLGDRLLVQFARFLNHRVRTEDPVIRTGGDEFAVLLPGLDLDGTREVVGRLKAAGPDSAPVSFTIGWAVRKGREPVEETLRRADQVLLQVRVEERQPRARRRDLSDE
jgi:diguanylate cyclase (GGDEF)-like protein/PAS domain S-box-containing protein